MNARHSKMQRHRAGDGGTHWISYSDMMASLLLIFILAIVLSIYNYYQLLETKTRELGEQQAQLDAAQLTLAKQEKELETTRVTLMGKEKELSVIQIQLDNQKDALKAAQAKLSEREQEIDKLQIVLTEKESELSSYQMQIADLLGVRTRIVEDLKKALAKANIAAAVDPNTGDIVLESTLMFEFGKSGISEEGKAQLSRLMPIYLNVLLSPDYRDYVAEIIIEGHTDKTGTYASNLKLSQERALAVVNYCMYMETLPDSVKAQLQKIVTAQGRADSIPILDAFGQPDADRSRRVEIKFRLKDTEMIERMGEILSDLE